MKIIEKVIRLRTVLIIFLEVVLKLWAFFAIDRNIFRFQVEKFRGNNFQKVGGTKKQNLGGRGGVDHY